MDDVELDRLLAESRPRAPDGFADAVDARLIRRRREIRSRRLAFGFSFALAAAVLALAWQLARPKPLPSGWRADSVALADGTTREVAAGAKLVLLGAREVQVVVTGPARIAARPGLVWLERGAAQLRGDGAQVATEIGRVTALGADAVVDVELRRTPMEAATKKTAIGVGAAFGAAVLAVYVVHGGARLAVAGAAGETVLGPGDRAIATAGAPPLAFRAARPAVATAPPPTAPGNGPTRQALGQNGNAPRPAPSAASAREPDHDDDGHLDQEAIRASIIEVMPKIRECYEHALEKHPKLSGRILLNFKIVAKDGKGRIDTAEVAPPDDAAEDLNSPATEHCLLGVVAGAEFPAPVGGSVDVTYPIILKAE